jgi:hypothetical protein
VSGPEPSRAAKYRVERADGKPIPPDEPCFVIRAQDRFAVQAVDAYIKLVEGHVSDQMIADLQWHAADIIRWQLDHPPKVPD